jgi:hypothetical protein
MQQRWHLLTEQVPSFFTNKERNAPMRRMLRSLGWLTLCMLCGTALIACAQEQPRADTGTVGGLYGDEATPDAAGVTPAPAEVAPAASPTAAAQPGDQVAVSLTEYTIDMPTSLPAGTTSFMVTNNGTVAHNFEIEGQGIEEEFEQNRDGVSRNLYTVYLGSRRTMITAN